jgi:hypothetical protein
MTSEDRDVAIGIAGSGRVGTIALHECDRRAGGAVRRSRTAELGRLRARRRPWRLSRGS